jgi:4-hydroxybenzoate polyprenyltransferase
VGEDSAGARSESGTRQLALKTKALVSACHPEPAATVALGAGVLALGAGRGWATLLVVAAIGAGQLAVGWSNDYLDRDTDRAAGRLDKPIPAGRISARAVGGAAVAALVACVPLSLASGLASALTHFVALACALAYNAGLKTRPISVLPYAAAFGLLPAIVTLGLPAPHWPPAWAVAAGALIGTGGHFTQVLSDIPSDRALGSAGLPQLLGQRVSAAVAALLLGAATAVVTFGPGRPGPLPLLGLGVSAVLTAGILGAAARGGMRTAFRLTLAVAAVAVLTFLGGGRSL